MRPLAAGRPGSMVSPPRFGKHQGFRVTSMRRAGSQTPSDRPMRGIGVPQKQIGEPGLGVSGAPDALPMEIGPIEIGNRHSQQTSEIGLTKRPVQDWADAAPDHRTASRTMSATGPKRRFIPGIPVRRRRLYRYPALHPPGPPAPGPGQAHRNLSRPPSRDPGLHAARTGC